MGQSDAKGNNGARKTKSVVGLWRPNKGNDGAVQWSDIDASVIRLFVDSVARAGGAAMMGVTTDGGAYSICVLLDNQKIKQYPSGKADCEDLLRSIGAYCTDSLL